MSKEFIVKYCETVNHFYYKRVNANDMDKAVELADNNNDDWIEDGTGELEERELVEVYNTTDDKFEYQY